MSDKKEKKQINDGMIKKGGVNPKPSTPKPTVKPGRKMKPQNSENK
jgi:hypothetical protein